MMDMVHIARHVCAVMVVADPWFICMGIFSVGILYGDLVWEDISGF